MNLFTKTEIELRMQKTNLGLPRGERRGDKLGDWDEHIHTTMYKIDN